MNYRIFLIVVSVFFMGASPARSADPIPRALLVEMAGGQFDALCGSEVFAQCMGFTETECKTLSDNAIKQCLMPLPETIDPEKLDNDALESCPREFFADAGHSEEKAGMCFDKAMEAAAVK